VKRHWYTPRLSSPAAGDDAGPAARVLTLLQDERVRYANQPIAVVVADTLETAQHATSLVKVGYAAEPPNVRMETGLDQSYVPRRAGRPDQESVATRGDVAGAIAAAPVQIEPVYTTPFETHVAMEPHATIAVWDDVDHLTLYDATQGIHPDRKRVAQLLGLPAEHVRVISEFLGGGFGSKGPTWSHVVLTAMAARIARRPVKLALTRPQTFGMVGWRSRTRQSFAVGAQRDGTLSALRHDTIAQTSTFDEFMEAAGMPSRMLYAVPSVATSHRLVRTDIGTPSYTRAPGWAPGTFALECAMDEMAYAVEMDPLAFRLRNYAETDPDSGHPWSFKALRECYRVGADRFGWARRPPSSGALRDGHVLVGWGMATSVYPAHRSPASALARLLPNGTVLLEAGTQDLGTGTYTIMTQVAADALGLAPSRVTFRLGDTRLPETPVSGGSQTAASVGCAVHAAATALRERLTRLGITDWRLPAGEVIEARGQASPGDEAKHYAAYAFGAQFAEVRVDATLGTVRVSRLVGVFDGGRILNAKTARNNLAGGMVWGVGMALHEQTIFDERLGRVVNNNLAEYHVPVNADIPAVEVSFIEQVDPHVNPIGVKGLGELGITGAAAAVANAVFHATGKRVRDLPITVERLL
jgi:xanthine dehydrogenase YagR molybdenum-binding subunit